MAHNNSTPPPQQQQHMGPMRHGVPPVKPKNMRGTLLRLWDLTKGKRKGLNWILLLSIFASASSILSPLLIGNVVNQINNGNPALWFLIILAGLYITDWLVRFLQQFFMVSIAQNIILHIRRNLFSVMKTLPLSFFDRRQHGELMSRLTNDVDNISTTISDSLSQLMVYGFTILGVFTIMMYLNVILTCVSLLAVVLIFILTKTITTRTRSLFILQQSILGKLNGQVEESISGLSMVKAYCREQNMIDQFEQTNEEFYNVATRALIWSGYLMPIMNVINNLNFVAIAVFSGIMAAKGIITIGLISSFLLYSRQFARPFVDIANLYNNFQTAVAGAERIFQILDEKGEPKDLPKAMETVRG
ncbi:MAG TPA: ABC transporter ATP-binding protein, partial [Treponemataceae bacterium]|nr:ABC transporter ATP-binding protein [Treponemataceae bacterium]